MNEQDKQRLMDDVKEVKEYLREIKVALEGNSKLGIKGIVKMVERHENWINNVNLRVAFWSGVSTTVVLVAKWLVTGHI